MNLPTSQEIYFYYEILKQETFLFKRTTSYSDYVTIEDIQQWLESNHLTVTISYLLFLNDKIHSIVNLCLVYSDSIIKKTWYCDITIDTNRRKQIASSQITDNKIP